MNDRTPRGDFEIRKGGGLRPGADVPAGDLSKIAQDLDALIADSQKLTQSEFAAARQRFMDGLAQTRRQSERVGERISAARARTNDYIRGHPWQAAGSALGVGVLVGMLIARR